MRNTRFHTILPLLLQQRVDVERWICRSHKVTSGPLRIALPLSPLCPQVNIHLTSHSLWFVYQPSSEHKTPERGHTETLFRMNSTDKSLSSYLSWVFQLSLSDILSNHKPVTGHKPRQAHRHHVFTLNTHLNNKGSFWNASRLKPFFFTLREEIKYCQGPAGVLEGFPAANIKC